MNGWEGRRVGGWRDGRVEGVEERGDDVMAMRYLWFVYYEGYGTTGWDRVLGVWQWCLVLGVFGLSYRWVFFGLGWRVRWYCRARSCAWRWLELIPRQCKIHALDFEGIVCWNVQCAAVHGRRPQQLEVLPWSTALCR